MISTMDTARVFLTGRSQAVRLPKAYRFKDSVIGVRREGDAVVLEPIRGRRWPAGFWKQIRIDDNAFARAPQGVAQRRRGLDAEG